MEINNEQLNSPLYDEVKNTNRNREKRVRDNKDINEEEAEREDFFCYSFNVYVNENQEYDINNYENFNLTKENSFLKNKKRRKKKHENGELLDNTKHTLYQNNQTCHNSSTNGTNQTSDPSQHDNSIIPKPKPNSQMIRINYLLQASYLMNHVNDTISRRYIKSMRRIANKHLIKFNARFKKLYCKICNNVLIPSVSCDVSIEPGPAPIHIKDKDKTVKNSEKKEETINHSNTKQKDAYLVCYTCKHCKHKTKFTYRSDTPNEDHEITEMCNDTPKGS